MYKIALLLSLALSVLFGKTSYTNALVESKSPYLLQHAHNPVNWYPYDDVVLKRAQKENKLIFLSIGYSTCHWCHVMEKESFESEEIAALLNKDYINIKVDKEEMPQIDIHFQHLHSLLKKGRNGWPLTVIMTAQKEVLYIATYIPPHDAYGLEGLDKLLPRLSKLFTEDKIRFINVINANKMIIANKSIEQEIVLESNATTLYLGKMKNRYDRIYKGFDKRPRFPLASHLNALLEVYFLTGEKAAYEMVKSSLDAIANGGIYDQVEGGFFRYATDQDWIVPHFEKMLYTQAELIPLYVKLYLLEEEPLYKKVIEETVALMDQKYREDNLFFAASDADSEGKEGRYFVYNQDKVISEMKKRGYCDKLIEETLEYFDITSVGNFEDGLSNVHFNTGFDEKPKKVEESLKILDEMRAKRPFPFIDKKIITSWNAMYIKALFSAVKIEHRYLEQAEISLEALLKKHYQKGVLYHYSIGDNRPTDPALLEDYAFLVDLLLKAYQVTFKEKYLQLAEILTKESEQKFYKLGRWYLDDGSFGALSQYEDRYYTTALSRHLHNMLDLALLKYDLKRLSRAKQYIQEERNRILAKIDSSPEALLALLRLQYENVILKSDKKLLSKSYKQIDKIHYPFLLQKAEKTDMFLLCNAQSCFFYDKNLTKVIEKMKK
ncbi:MAG: DUF255 domain-containing protein [Epsilonproteobacteria bacterium]|nr:DUF255 domain-containing protein [Campylobacterota bacterium]